MNRSFTLRQSFVCIVTFIFSIFLPQLLLAQDAGSAQAVESALSSGDTTLLGMFQSGGIAMYPLLLFSVLTLGLVIYNAMTIREASIINHRALSENVAPALEELDIARAIEACEESPSPVLRILGCGLATTESGKFEPEKIDQAFDEAASVELSKPLIFINYLQVIASVSPMVGLLGTVSGMVKAFRTISEQGMGRPELLAENISEALITTASGLLVAIPALLAYFYFKNTYGKIAAKVSQILGRTLRSLTERINSSNTSAA